MGEHWRKALQEQRQRLGISRAELARRASLSPETVRAYEKGRRHPRRESLIALLDALKTERATRNEILGSAGFPADGEELGLTDFPGYMFTVAEATELIDRYNWPSFLLNESMEVLAANHTAQRLWDVDLRTEFTDSIDRSLLSVASNPRFADRCANWSEVMAVMVSVFKGWHRGPESYDEPSPYFGSVLEEFLRGDKHYVGQFAEIWERTPPITQHKIRWAYPVVWQEPDVGALRFECLVTAANEPDGLAFNDWIPLDAATWTALDAIKRRTRPRSS